MFFAETQNKLLFAITGENVAEIVISRADANNPIWLLKVGKEKL